MFVYQQPQFTGNQSSVVLSQASEYEIATASVWLQAPKLGLKAIHVAANRKTFDHEIIRQPLLQEIHRNAGAVSRGIDRLAKTFELDGSVSARCSVLKNVTFDRNVV